MLHMRRFRPDVYWFAFVVLAVATRIAVWTFSGPIILDDSATYLELADQIRHLDFSNYSGIRTPGYPLLMIAAGMNTHTVWIFQSVIGVLTGALVFSLVSDWTKSKGAGCIAGGVQTLNPFQLLPEATVLTETLTAFLLTLSLYLATRAFDSHSRVVHLSLGSTLGLVVLTRPLFLAVIPVYATVLWFGRPGISGHERNFSALWAAGPTVFLLAAWVAFNSIMLGYPGLTTLTGYNLVQHTGAFFELAPDQWEPLRSIFLRYRDLLGTHTMAIWAAHPDMRMETGYSFSELSLRLTAMSLDLIVSHPLRYIASVGYSLIQFWIPFAWWHLRTYPGPLQGYLAKYVLAGAALLMGLELWTPVALVFLWRRRPIRPVWNLIMLTCGVIIFIDVAQALIERGENFRYSAPIQPFVVAVAVWAARFTGSRA